jgi:hypothetical protein
MSKPCLCGWLPNHAKRRDLARRSRNQRSADSLVRGLLASGLRLADKAVRAPRKSSPHAKMFGDSTAEDAEGSGDNIIAALRNSAFSASPRSFPFLRSFRFDKQPDKQGPNYPHPGLASGAIEAKAEAASDSRQLAVWKNCLQQFIVCPALQPIIFSQSRLASSSAHNAARRHQGRAIGADVLADPG